MDAPPSTTSPHFVAVRCAQCGHCASPDLALVQCEMCGGGWLDADYDITAISRLWPGALMMHEYGVETLTRQGMWRYAEMLPVNLAYCVTMGEGWTPLMHAERLGEALGHAHLYIKDERLSPTSSFKDRQASLAVSALNALGVTECVMASSGNAGTAYAAYCARAGIKLWVFFTSRVPAAKVREATLYGAEVVKVTGTYDQAKQVAKDFADRRGLFLERGAKAVVGKESMKTIAYEIAEQLGWCAPDWYIQAVSGGIGPIGVWKGFEELLQLGLIDRLPKLAVVQTEGCAPMANAFLADQERADPVTPRTAITILTTGDPGQAYVVLRRAVLQGGGTMLAVSDTEAFRALRRLARVEGISVEPATAVAFAGLERMLGEGFIGPDETVVVNASGHTLPVETFIIGDQYALDLQVDSPLLENWGLPEEGLGAALEYLDERITSVVVIDDSPEDCRLVRRLLQRHKSYRIFEAHSGTEGLNLIRERRPDLVVLDLILPDMDGLDVLEAIRQDARTTGIPVIVVTGKALGPQERRRLEGQMVSVWQKGSFSARELAEHIVALLGGASPQERPLARVSRILTDRLEASDEAPLVLVIDDNPLDARLLRRILEQHNHCRVLEAHTGEQAVAVLAEHHPALVILDLILPDISGFDVLAQIPSDVPVIVLTAKDLSAEEQSQLERRVRSLWRKGALDRALLQADVRQTLEGET